MRYDPAVYTSITTLDAAKRIILTPEPGLTTEERWERETPHVCDLIEHQMKIDGNTVVLDYGCGVGRISKELIKRHACYVVGVDISPNMRALAASYVGSDRFLTCAPSMLDVLGMKFNIVISVWVLQHVHLLRSTIKQIDDVLQRPGWLFVVNEGENRFVPTREGWASDGLNVQQILDEQFLKVSSGHMDEAIVGETAKRTFWAAYSRW